MKKLRWFGAIRITQSRRQHNHLIEYIYDTRTVEHRLVMERQTQGQTHDDSIVIYHIASRDINDDLTSTVSTAATYEAMKPATAEMPLERPMRVHAGVGRSDVHVTDEEATKSDPTERGR